MKKIICLLLTMLLLISAINPVMANNNITVKIDGQQIAFDVQPQLINNRTMVPLRAIFEALGATVDWNGDTQTVTSTKGNTTISLTINNPAMYINGVSITLDSPACLVNGRTLVPVRAIAEAFNTTVEWNDRTKTVLIKTSKEQVNSEKIVTPPMAPDKAFDKLVNIITNKTQTSSYSFSYKYGFKHNSLEFLYNPPKGKNDIDKINIEYTNEPYVTTLIIFKNKNSAGTLAHYTLSKLETSGTWKGYHTRILAGDFNPETINHLTTSLPYDNSEWNNYDPSNIEPAIIQLKELLFKLDSCLQPQLRVVDLGFVNYDPSNPPSAYYDDISNDINIINSYISQGLYLEAINHCNNVIGKYNISPDDKNTIQTLLKTAQTKYDEYTSKININKYQTLLTEENKNKMYEKSEEKLKSRLNYPLTYKFNSVNYSAEADGIHVIVRYEAANGFGVYSSGFAIFVFNERLYIIDETYSR